MDDSQITPEQIAELQAKADKAEHLEEQLRERDERLAKVQDKELNFEKLRKASKEEKEKLLSEFTSKERMLVDEMESFRRESEDTRKEMMKNAKESVLEDLAGDNENLRKSIEEQAKEFIGDPKTPQEVEARLRKSYTLVTNLKPRSAPINRFVPSTSYTSPNVRQQKFVDTDEGRATFKQLFGREPGAILKKK